MRLALKHSVRLAQLQPQMLIAVLVFLGVVEDLIEELVVTSANDSTHSTQSKHFSGNALDFRTHNLYSTLTSTARHTSLVTLVNQLQVRLPGFDVVLESFNTPNEHIHIEYDPKYTNKEPAVTVAA